MAPDSPDSGDLERRPDDPILRPGRGGRIVFRWQASEYEQPETEATDGTRAGGQNGGCGTQGPADQRGPAQVVEDTTAKTLQGYVLDNTQLETTVYTDDARPYSSLKNHETVRHSALEFVRGPVHTNGVESFWSMLKRAHTGTFHKNSRAHLHRYIGEFAGRHNMRNKDTLDQMAHVIGPDEREAAALQGPGWGEPGAWEVNLRRRFGLEVPVG